MLELLWYLYTYWTKVQVSYIVSHTNRVLVQDRILYDLHNTRELMIMQMREKREGSKREVKSDPAGTHADLEITERCRQDFGGCADLDRQRHNWGNMSARMTECEILITNNTKYEKKQKTRPDSEHDRYCSSTCGKQYSWAVQNWKVSKFKKTWG